ncbi:MAG: DUF3734 domain-containing protein [Xanthobacteraceae bacterium]
MSRVVPSQVIALIDQNFPAAKSGTRFDVYSASAGVLSAIVRLLPPDIAKTAQAKRLYEYGCVTEMDIVQLIYRPIEPQGALKDFQFGRSTMETRWQQGLSDARTTLHASPWLAPMPKELGVRVFDVIHDILVRGHEQAA